VLHVGRSNKSPDWSTAAQMVEQKDTLNAAESAMLVVTAELCLLHISSGGHLERNSPHSAPLIAHVVLHHT
jgi:hypothetical protein